MSKEKLLTGFFSREKLVEFTQFDHATELSQS
jgi:hypothetical protein